MAKVRSSNKRASDEALKMKHNVIELTNFQFESMEDQLPDDCRFHCASCNGLTLITPDASQRVCFRTIDPEPNEDPPSWAYGGCY